MKTNDVANAIGAQSNKIWTVPFKIWTAVVDLKQTVARLETQFRETQEAGPSLSTYLRGSARALIDKGYFREAVRAYDQVIEKHPGVHTNYIGRARAKLLAGDADGAMQDLSTAANLYPYDPVIERLRLQIRGSDGGLNGGPARKPFTVNTDEPMASPLRPAQEAVWEGNSRLARGGAAGAFAAYTRAQELGWSEVYSRFNQAMSLCLAKRKDEALQVLEQILPDQRSFMEVNVLALRCLVRCSPIPLP